MTTAIKRIVTVFLVLVISLLSVGYASMTDTLYLIGNITSSRTVTWLHVSEAYASSGAVLQMSGSEDRANPSGWTTMQLSFDSPEDVITVTLTLTNASGANLGAKAISCEATDGTSGITFTATNTTPDWKYGTLNRDGYVVDGTEIAPKESISNVTVEIRASAACTAEVTLSLLFGYPGEADLINNTIFNAAKMLEHTLNDKNNSITFDQFVDAIDKGWYGSYIGNVAGSNTTDNAVMDRIFGDTLNKIVLDPSSPSEKCTVIINGDDIDDNRVYMYMSIEDPSDYRAGSNYQGSYTNTSATLEVYAIALDLAPDAEGNATWTVYGDMYVGRCNPNCYNGRQTYCNSFNTGTWRSSATTDQRYTGLSGTKYDTGAGLTIAQVIDLHDSK